MEARYFVNRLKLYCFDKKIDSVPVVYAFDTGFPKDKSFPEDKMLEMQKSAALSYLKITEDDLPALYKPLPGGIPGIQALSRNAPLQDGQ